MGPFAARPYRQCLAWALLLLVWGCSCAAQPQYNSTSLTVTDVITSRSNLVSLPLSDPHSIPAACPGKGSFHAVSNSRSCLHPACVRPMHCTAAQTFFDALLESTGLKDTLKNGDGNYTILAPHNSAWSQALTQNTLDCTADFYITSECNDIQDLLTATNLKDILLGHSEASRLPSYTDCCSRCPSVLDAVQNRSDGYLKPYASHVHDSHR